jgi:acetyl esterase/lipase
MISKRAKLVRAATGKYFSSRDPRSTDVVKLRKRLDSWAQILRTPRGIHVTREEFQGMQAEWLTPRQFTEGKLLLYLHGGGYVFGSCATHRQMVSYIARAGRVRALLPEYRLAPEHPFPAAIEDIVRVYRALLDAGHSPRDIVIAGDSAGGGLTLATLLTLRDAGDALPAAACLLSPWLDLTGSGESMRTNAQRDPWFKPEFMPLLVRHYCADDERTHPLVSPVFADLGGLPPLFVQVCDDEILLSDSIRVVEKARAAGGEACLETYSGLWHVFQAFARQVPESRAAVARIGSYIERKLG